ncbi:glycosyl hydrolase family 2 [Acidipila sp. EB88]|nr:glycosyl hydrolase family 2 [Acidipila sp. EB88]
MLVCVAATIAHARPLAQPTSQSIEAGWQLQSACSLQADGAAISRSDFVANNWIPTTVPSTVLAAQAAAKLVPDPFYGDNLRHLAGTDYPAGKNFSNLPMAGTSPYACGWWYRTTLNAPATAPDGHTWLHFGGINYRADIWLNGTKIAGRDNIAGAYRTYDLDVTAAIKPGGNNVLAVETFAPTEKDLGINWVDWNPSPPDKDMGLWGAVDLVHTGPVTVRSPLAVTHFSDASLHAADLAIYVELQNATDHAVTGTAQGTAAGANFQQRVELAPHEHKTVEFDAAHFPALHLANVKPWWPAQMGEPHLEPLSIGFSIAGVESDRQFVRFGIREMTSELTAGGARLFRVNGKPILIRGGGWSQDMLLRTDAKRLDDQFKLVRDLNLNTIRLEGKLETDLFFQKADEQGLLVMLGWCCCDHWEDWKTWTPADLGIATDSLRAQMLRLRHHASLLVWLNGSDNAPPADVEKAYLQVETATHWPNPVLAAASAAETPGGGEDGVKMTGPYDYVAPSYWYVDQHNGGAFGFNTETSPGPAIPSLGSREKFLPDAAAWPPSATWSLHNGGGEFANLTVFNQSMEAVYAKPSSAADYERMAQTMEYDSERAMFESYGKNKYTSTGVVQWMLNNAWPSMIWHLYDYYLDAGAGYFAAKKACEPVHIQYSYDDRSIVVVNSTYQPLDALHATVHVHNAAWQELYSTEADLGAGSDSTQRIATLPERLYSGGERLLFIDLSLKDRAGHEVSRNFYWVPTTLTSFDWHGTDFTHTPAARHEDLTALNTLPRAEIATDVELRNTPRGREVLVHFHNTSAHLGFQVHAAIRTPTGGLVAPVLWSDNWIEIPPGESTTLTALLPDNAGDTPVVQVQGWNVAATTLALNKTPAIP